MAESKECLCMFNLIELKSVIQTLLRDLPNGKKWIEDRAVQIVFLWIFV